MINNRTNGQRWKQGERSWRGGTHPRAAGHFTISRETSASGALNEAPSIQVNMTQPRATGQVSKCSEVSRREEPSLSSMWSHMSQWHRDTCSFHSVHSSHDVKIRFRSSQREMQAHYCSSWTAQRSDHFRQSFASFTHRRSYVAS